jgi:hypothetical protein
MIRKSLLALALPFLLFSAVLFVSAPPASAVDLFKTVCTGTDSNGKPVAITPGKSATTDVCKEGTPAVTKNPVISALGIAITIISIIIGVASIIVIILSAFRMITSNGNSQQVASARSGIIYALVGIFISVLATTLVTFVLNKL